MRVIYNLTTEKLALYRATAQRRREQEQAEQEYRRKQALSVARQAALLLRERFKVTRVVIFGSLAHRGGFTRWSDVDIAAWGIAPQDTFRAIGVILDMNTQVAINLVDVNACRSSLLEVIEQDGIDI